MLTAMATRGVKRGGIIKISSLTIAILLISVFATPVEAATFDGTYDVTFKFVGPSRQTLGHTNPSGFVVSNGQISSKPSGYARGSVDAGGNARWTGPCANGDPFPSMPATFTGVLRADGTGGGNYRCQSGATGTWSVRRVSGGGTGNTPSMDTESMINILWTILILAGTILLMVIVYSLLGGSKPSQEEAPKPPATDRTVRYYSTNQPGYSTGQPRDRWIAGQPRVPGGPTYSSGDVGTHEVPASFPTAEGGRPIGGVGITAPPPTAPPVSNLRLSMEGNMARLEWDPPVYDTSKTKLVGYEVYRYEEVQWSTARERISLETLEPEVHRYEVPHMERSGNYGVRPVYRTPEGVVFGPGFGGAAF